MNCNSLITRWYSQSLFCILLVLAGISSSFSLSGQSMTERKELFDDGEFFFNSEDYKEAVFYYQKLLAANPGNGNINFQLAMCYLNIPGEEVKAVPYLEKAAEKISLKYKKSEFEETKAPLHVYFYLAQA